MYVDTCVCICVRVSFVKTLEHFDATEQVVIYFINQF